MPLLAGGALDEQGPASSLLLGGLLSAEPERGSFASAEPEMKFIQVAAEAEIDMQVLARGRRVPRLLRDRIRVNLQLQHGFSTGIAAVSHDSPHGSTLSQRPGRVQAKYPVGGKLWYLQQRALNEVSHGLQLQSLWRIPTAAVS